ncbi:hypothetical protein BGZ81_006632 [Podila clonocystis]|nr:hypothetical protein BGZ81_006632 [Podila clonocystis]
MDRYPNAQQANTAPFTQDSSRNRIRKDHSSTTGDTGNTHRINLSQSGSINNINTLQIDEDDDDLENLPDDDLLLWTTAQFTFDENNTNIHDQQALMALKLAQQQHQQQQNLQQQQHLQHNMSNHNPSQGHPLPYHNPVEMQRQLQQFDAIHRYLDGNSDGQIQDSRSSQNLLERSRQRNPIPLGHGSNPQPMQGQYPVYEGAVTSGHDQPNIGETHLNLQQQHQQQYALYNPSSSGPSSGQFPPVAARLHRQPYPGQQQQPQPQPQPQQFPQAASSLPTQSYMNHVPNEGIHGISNLSLSSKTNHGDDSVPSTPYEEKLILLEGELEEYEFELERRKSSGTSSRQSSIVSSGSSSTAGGSTDNPNNQIHVGPGTISIEDPDYAAQRLAAEEDKRRRNTAASARFRHKKRLREQILEKTAKEMTAKSEILESKVRELEMEIKWLRGLIVEKETRILEGLPSSTNAILNSGSLLLGSSSSTSGGNALSSSLPASSMMDEDLSAESSAKSPRRKRP